MFAVCLLNVFVEAFRSLRYAPCFSIKVEKIDHHHFWFPKLPLATWKQAEQHSQRLQSWFNLVISIRQWPASGKKTGMNTSYLNWVSQTLAWNLLVSSMFHAPKRICLADIENKKKPAWHHRKKSLPNKIVVKNGTRYTKTTTGTQNWTTISTRLNHFQVNDIMIPEFKTCLLGNIPQLSTKFFSADKYGALFGCLKKYVQPGNHAHVRVAGDSIRDPFFIHVSYRSRSQPLSYRSRELTIPKKVTCSWSLVPGRQEGSWKQRAPAKHHRQSSHVPFGDDVHSLGEVCVFCVCCFFSWALRCCFFLCVNFTNFLKRSEQHGRWMRNPEDRFPHSIKCQIVC